ncbi:MAG: DUF998 domain-containing protein [Candidatus Bathyarchaeia archaeon]
MRVKPMSKHRLLVRFSRICGIISPVFTFTCIMLAITSYPEFSWTNNALSDLGTVEGFTGTIFNLGLLTGGFLALIFALGLFIIQKNILGKLGSLVFALAAISLSMIGIFPENIEPIHYHVSVAFFTLAPIALIILSVAFIQAGKKKLGLFTLFMALTAAVIWIYHWTFGFGANVAIPETLSALALSAWVIKLSHEIFINL